MAILKKNWFGRMLFIIAVIYSIGSCTDNDPVSPPQSSDGDSLILQDDSDTLAGQDNSDSLDLLTAADSAFYNSNGKILHAVCYGPFRDWQAPGSILSGDQVKEDLLIMQQHWDAFRLYTTDANAERILKVISVNDIHLNVMLGVWISGRSPTDNARQVENAISLANLYPDIVQAISCGNEIFGLEGSDIFVWDKNEIIGYLNDMKKRTDVPVTIDDIYFVWMDDYYSDVVDALDFLTIHFYGQWSNIPLENTVSAIDEVYKHLRAKFPEKEIVIGETGWTTGKREGQFGPMADEASQKQFYEACQAWSELNKVTVFYFEAFDELWKGDSYNEAETNWGFYHSNRTPKLVFQTED